MKINVKLSDDRLLYPQSYPQISSAIRSTQPTEAHHDYPRNRRTDHCHPHPPGRIVKGLEYGASHYGRRFVRPAGMTLWGLARELPGEDLPKNATILDELTAELEWS